MLLVGLFTHIIGVYTYIRNWVGHVLPCNSTQVIVTIVLRILVHVMPINRATTCAMKVVTHVHVNLR